MRRYTGPSHPEYTSLKQALDKIHTIAVSINEGKRQAENMSKLCELTNRIQHNEIELIQPHRRLIREGILSSIQTGRVFASIKTKKRNILLFNDCLLWTNYEKWEFKGCIDLTAANATQPSNTTIELTTAKQLLLLQGDSK